MAGGILSIEMKRRSMTPQQRRSVCNYVHAHYPSFSTHLSFISHFHPKPLFDN